jgi:hypothetical protein
MNLPIKFDIQHSIISRLCLQPVAICRLCTVIVLYSRGDIPSTVMAVRIADGLNKYIAPPLASFNWVPVYRLALQVPQQALPSVL